MVGWSAPLVVGWWVGALVGPKEAGLVLGLLGWCGVWRVGGFFGGALDDEMAGGTLGLQLFVITVSLSSSSSVRM
jgi:hypothetical protein